MCGMYTRTHMCVCTSCIYTCTEREYREPGRSRKFVVWGPVVGQNKKRSEGLFFLYMPAGFVRVGWGFCVLPRQPDLLPLFFYVCCCKSSPPLGGSVRFRSSTAATTKLYIHTVCVYGYTHSRAPFHSGNCFVCLVFFFFNGGGVLLFEWNPNRIRRWPELATQDIHLSRSRAKMVSNFPQYSITSLYDC